MKELLRTNDIVLISFVESLLKEQNIEHIVVDQHMSILEGSVGAIPRRLLVDSDFNDQARRILHDAGIGNELSETDQ